MSQFIQTVQGKRDLVIISQDYISVYQHYVQNKGWFSCLKKWCPCPFCIASVGVKYRCKKRYYFDVIELDRQNSLTSKILVLSKKQGEELIDLLTRIDYKITGKPFSVEKFGENTQFKLIDVDVDMTLYCNVLLHDWEYVTRPISKEKSQQIVNNDQQEYKA